jgi:hypothetical protein
MDDLTTLSPDRFEQREWTALQWVRTYLVFEGAFPDENLTAAFARQYSPAERTDIFAVFKLMLFFNMLMNTLFGKRKAV